MSDNVHQLVQLTARICWQCGGDVPALNYPSHFCCARCVEIYWGIEGSARPTLTVD